MIRRLIFAVALAMALAAKPAIATDGVRNVVLVHDAKTITLPSSHVAMLSHPVEVVKLIIEAARTAPVNQ